MKINMNMNLGYSYAKSKILFHAASSTLEVIQSIVGIVDNDAIKKLCADKLEDLKDINSKIGYCEKCNTDVTWLDEDGFCRSCRKEWLDTLSQKTDQYLMRG